MMVAHTWIASRVADRKKRNARETTTTNLSDCSQRPVKSRPCERRYFECDTPGAQVRDLGHDLRTPLNAIIGFSEILLSEVYGPIENERYLEYINDVHRSGIALLALVENLLDETSDPNGGAPIDKQAPSMALRINPAPGRP